jgi:hypothetical protein
MSVSGWKMELRVSFLARKNRSHAVEQYMVDAGSKQHERSGGDILIKKDEKSQYAIAVKRTRMDRCLDLSQELRYLAEKRNINKILIY